MGQLLLLYSWRFSRYRAPIHWLVHGHMTSNNETASRQMPWKGNIAKTMTSNGKQFTVTGEMLTAVACDRWNLSAVFKFCFCFVLLYNKSLNDWSLGEQWILFPSTLSRETLRFSGNKIHCSPRDQSLSVECNFRMDTGENNLQVIFCSVKSELKQAPYLSLSYFRQGS